MIESNSSNAIGIITITGYGFLQLENAKAESLALPLVQAQVSQVQFWYVAVKLWVIFKEIRSVLQQLGFLMYKRYLLAIGLGLRAKRKLRSRYSLSQFYKFQFNFFYTCKLKEKILNFMFCKAAFMIAYVCLSYILNQFIIILFLVASMLILILMRWFSCFLSFIDKKSYEFLLRWAEIKFYVLA
jgi:hypothetical protein